MPTLLLDNIPPNLKDLPLLTAADRALLASYTTNAQVICFDASNPLARPFRMSITDFRKITNGMTTLGYTTGAGGAVTQATSKSTGVTLNNVTGAITLNGAALTNGSTATFTVTNSAIGANDNVVINHKSGGTLGGYGVKVHSIAAGSFKISVKNESGGDLSEAPVLQFSIIGGAIA